MKHTLLLLSMAFASSIAFGQFTENESLANVVLAETDAFYNRNADAWQQTWLHSNKISRTLISNDKYSKVSGWNNYAPPILKFIKKTPKEGSVIVTNDSFDITKKRDTAWIEYRQVMSTSGPDSTITQISKEYRVLVKKNRDWKIVSMITHAPSDFRSISPADLENNMNTTGHKLLNSGKKKDAIEVFKLNVKLNPASWVCHNSLAEAYALTGNKKLAIESYKKSAKLNPHNEVATKALKRLKA